MSQAAGFTKPGGGGGGGTVNSLTPDIGGAVSAVGGTIPTLGYKAGVVPTLQTYNDLAGNFRISDQTWWTQYVVDPSTVPGLKGTFQTIQAAITQAEADGAAFGTNAVIYIRSPPGVAASYAEDLTINGGIILVGESGFGPNGLLTYSPLIVGNHTFGNLAALQANNVAFQNDASGNLTIFTSSGAQTLFSLSLNDCVLVNNQGPTGGFVNSNAGFNEIFMKGCFCDTGGVFNAFIMPGLTNCYLRDTQFAGAGWSTDSGIIRTNNCQDIGPVVLGSGNIAAYNCTFSADTTDNISGTSSTNILVNCVFSSNIVTTKAISASGGFEGWGNSISALAVGPGSIFGTTLPVLNTAAMGGSILTGVSVATSYAATKNDWYIGITNTSVARTVTLPAIAEVAVGQSFIVKDESMLAAVNNITISGTGTTIDGAATYVLNTNGAAATIRSNGTAYFITAVQGL